MALVKCTECKNKISKSAETCPNCGHTKNSTSLLPWVLLFVFCWLIYTFVPFKKVTYNTSHQTASKQEKPPSAEEVASEERFQKVVAYGQILKASMREPKSIEWISILSNNDASIICYVYRGKNGFGGTSIENVSVVNGEMHTESKIWNKNCANKSLNDLIFARKAIN